MARLVLQGVAMGGFLLLGRLFPRVAAQPLLRRDMVFNLLNGLLLFVLVAPLVRLVQGALPAGGLLAVDAWGPVLQGLLSFVLLDFARYWLHRAAHRVPLLWRFHRVHHSAESLDSTVGLRMHAVDFLQLSALPILLFGVLFDTRGWHPAVIPAVMGVGVVFDAFQHANLRWDPAHPLARLWGRAFNNPHFHSWHHTRDGATVDGNYGNTLVLWDRLFGSDVTRPGLPAAFGVSGDQALAEGPLAWQLLRPRRA